MLVCQSLCRRQLTPDLCATERLLATRYAYWDDDVPHDDPFAYPPSA
jgi:hypothetical protein